MNRALVAISTVSFLFSTNNVIAQDNLQERVAALRSGSPHTFVEGCNQIQSCVDGMKNGGWHQLSTQQIRDGWDHCRESLQQKSKKKLEFHYGAVISQPINQDFIDVKDLQPNNQYYTGHIRGYMRTSRDVYRFYCDFASAGWIKKTEITFDSVRR